MRCNTQYMNVNLTEAEATVFNAIRRITSGRGWTSRRNLENALKGTGISQQRLDRILNRLEEWGYINRMRTKDGGSVVKMCSAITSAYTNARAYYMDTRGKSVIEIGAPSVDLVVEELLLKTILEEGSTAFGSHRERRDLQRHAKKRLAELKERHEKTSESE
jgi:DNA-binding MarR family transcriptional regulator